MEKIIRDLLKAIGEDPKREGLQSTPKRVSESFKFLTEGYRQDPRSLIKKSMYKEKHEEMVFVKDIQFYSLCEHHLLPFFGKAHVAYIPNDRIVGISKIARMVDLYSRRLQVQERLFQGQAHAVLPDHQAEFLGNGCGHLLNQCLHCLQKT